MYLGIELLLIAITNNLAGNGIMTSPNIFKISPGMPFRPTDFFFQIVDNSFLITLIRIVKGFLKSVV